MSLSGDLEVIFAGMFAEEVTFTQAGTVKSGISGVFSNPGDWSDDISGFVADRTLVQIRATDLGTLTPAKRDTIIRYPGEAAAETWQVDTINLELGLYTFNCSRHGRPVPR